MDVGVRDLKARLSEYLARVERGEVIGVTSRGRRSAEIVPALRTDNVERGIGKDGSRSDGTNRPLPWCGSDPSPARDPRPS